MSSRQNDETLSGLLDQIESEQATGPGGQWYGQRPLNSEDMTWLRARCPQVPHEYELFLTRSNGGEWLGRAAGGYCAFLDAFSVADVNSWVREYLPGMFVFASDGGPNFFLLDLENRHGRNEGSVWRVSQGATFEDELRYMAPDFAAFLGRLLEKRKLVPQPTE